MVEEDQIASAILMLLERKKILAEGAGAVTLSKHRRPPSLCGRCGIGT
ncbi:hypothetical protein GMMP15_660054 [Candidatus Magnetomoraceae bacterium gMMP-15]